MDTFGYNVPFSLLSGIFENFYILSLKIEKYTLAFPECALQWALVPAANSLTYSLKSIKYQVSD